MLLPVGCVRQAVLAQFLRRRAQTVLLAQSPTCYTDQGQQRAHLVLLANTVSGQLRAAYSVVRAGSQQLVGPIVPYVPKARTPTLWHYLGAACVQPVQKASIATALP